MSGQLPGPCQNAEPCWGARGTFQNGRGGAAGALESVSTQWSPLFSFGLRAGWSRQNHGSGAAVVALSLFCKLIGGVVSHLLRGQCTWTGKHFGGEAFVNLSMDNKEAPCTLARVTQRASVCTRTFVTLFSLSALLWPCRGGFHCILQLLGKMAPRHLIHP